MTFVYIWQHAQVVTVLKYYIQVKIHKMLVRFQVVTAVLLKNVTFQDAMLRYWVSSSQHFEDHCAFIFRVK